MKIRLGFIAFILFYISSSSVAQWVPTKGPGGGSTYEVVNTGSALIVSAGNDGVYKSIDNGISWQKGVNGLPPAASIQALSEFGGLVYVAVYQKGIFLSVDDGESWTSINSGIENMTFYSLYVEGSNIYAGSSEGGTYYSANNGSSWSNTSGALTDQVTSFVNFNSKIYTGGRSLYEYNSTSSTWDPITITGLGVNGVSALALNAGTLYVADAGSVFISHDALNTWSQYVLDPFASVLSMGVSGDTVFVTSSSSRIYYTINDGADWTLLQNSQSDSFAYGALFLKDKIIMTTDDGIYSSFDEGIAWENSSSGMNSLQIKSLAYNGTTLYAGTDRQGIFKSYDDGDIWVGINQGLATLNSKSINDIIPINNTLYIGTSDGIYISNNDGISWDKAFSPGINRAVQTMNFKDGIFAAGVNGDGVYISLDTAKSWQLAPNNGLNINTSYYSNLVLGDTLVISTHDGQIWLSVDEANLWSDISIPGDFRLTYKLVFDNDILYAGTSKGLFKSNDLGLSWSLINNDTRGIKDIIVENSFYYAVTDTGILKSEIGLSTWHDVGSGLTGETPVRIIFAGLNAFVGTFNSSVWVRPKAELNIAPVIDALSNNISTLEDTSIEILLSDLIITDPDSNYPSDFSLTVLSGANYTVNNNEVIPGEDYYGTLNVAVFVNDSKDNGPYFDVIIEVIPVNDIPVIVDANSMLVTYLQTPLEITLNNLTVTDPDNIYPSEFIIIVREGDNYTLAGNEIKANSGFIGNLIVPVTVSDGIDESLPFMITVEVTDVMEVVIDDISGVSVYPNPSIDHLNIKIENDLRGILDFKLHSLAGKLIFERLLDKSESKLNFVIPLTGIIPGIYLVNIGTINGEQYQQRLIIN